MKLSIFKNMIREIIREELDYKFSRLRKELKEIVVKSNNSNVSRARTHTTQDTSLQNLMETDSRSNSNIPITNTNVSVPKTKNKVLNSEPKVESVQDNVSELPEHLANAFTKDYSNVMKKVDQKAKFKNGS